MPSSRVRTKLVPQQVTVSQELAVLGVYQNDVDSPARVVIVWKEKDVDGNYVEATKDEFQFEDNPNSKSPFAKNSGSIAVGMVLNAKVPRTGATVVSVLTALALPTDGTVTVEQFMEALSNKRAQIIAQQEA